MHLRPLSRKRQASLALCCLDSPPIGCADIDLRRPVSGACPPRTPGSGAWRPEKRRGSAVPAPGSEGANVTICSSENPQILHITTASPSGPEPRSPDPTAERGGRDRRYLSRPTSTSSSGWFPRSRSRGDPIRTPNGRSIRSATGRQWKVIGAGRGRRGRHRTSSADAAEIAQPANIPSHLPLFGSGSAGLGEDKITELPHFP